MSWMSYWIKSHLKLELFLNIQDFLAKTFFFLLQPVLIGYLIGYFNWVACNIGDPDWHAILPASIYEVTAMC